MTQGKRRKKSFLWDYLVKIIVGIFSLALIITAIYFGAPKVKALISSEAELPQAVNAEYKDTDKTLCSKFEELNVSCQVSWEISEEKPMGALIEQSPAPGTKSKTVKLIYSKGPSEVIVPILTGLEKDKAAEALWESGLGFEEFIEIDSTMTPGQIVDSSHQPTEKAKNGTKITLYFSSGYFTVPDWTGKSKEFVEMDSAKKGIVVKFKEIESDAPLGTVISQTETGSRVKYNSVIDVEIAITEGGDLVAIPSVVGLTQEEAISQLAGAGFLKFTSIIEINNAVETSKVKSISPETGTEVPVDTEITITVEKNQ